MTAAGKITAARFEVGTKVLVQVSEWHARTWRSQTVYTATGTKTGHIIATITGKRYRREGIREFLYPTTVGPLAAYGHSTFWNVDELTEKTRAKNTDPTAPADVVEPAPVVVEPAPVDVEVAPAPETYEEETTRLEARHADVTVQLEILSARENWTPEDAAGARTLTHELSRLKTRLGFRSMYERAAVRDREEEAANLRLNRDYDEAEAAAAAERAEQDARELEHLEAIEREAAASTTWPAAEASDRRRGVVDHDELAAKRETDAEFLERKDREMQHARPIPGVVLGYDDSAEQEARNPTPPEPCTTVSSVTGQTCGGQRGHVFPHWYPALDTDH